MNIAIIGYGKMGKEIEKIALSRKHKIVSIIDIDKSIAEEKNNLLKADVAIEFTTPETAVKNITDCFKINIPVVSGTTGWLNYFDEIKNACIKYKTAFFYSSNFSLGVNILFEINKKLSAIMNNFAEYDIEVIETHHINKLDSPSGTAVTIVNDIISNIERKNKWVNNIIPEKSEINIESIRKENITGIHTIKYESDVDIIELSHNAKNRKGFALGAVIAAEFLRHKTGVFGMNHLLNL